jgi:hypothetical protein
MAKNLLAALFVAVFGSSIYVYSNRDEMSLKENLARRDSDSPKLRIERVLIQRYKQSKLESQIEAHSGKLIEPNLFAVTGGFKAEKISDDKRQKLVADEALASFEATSLKGLGVTGDLLNVKMNKNVSIFFGEYQLLTEYAEYLVKINSIVGDLPVTVRGEKKWFRGQSGFRVDLQDEAVEIFGKVNGEALVK